MIDNYIKFVIKPTEQIRNELQDKVLKKGIFASKKEKEYLRKYNDLLFKEYILLEKMMIFF